MAADFLTYRRAEGQIASRSVSVKPTRGGWDDICGRPRPYSPRHRYNGLRKLLVVMILSAGFMGEPSAEADLIRGVAYVAAGVLEVPRSTLAGTMSGPLLLGTVFGALGGAVKGVGYIARGALEIVGSVVPIALKLAPLIPLFL